MIDNKPTRSIILDIEKKDCQDIGIIRKVRAMLTGKSLLN